MFYKKTLWSALPLFVCLSFAFPVRSAIYDPPMPDPLKRKADMSRNWQFYKGTPTGTPQALTYNDSGTGWSKVVVPHSCSYDAAPVVVTGPSNWASEWNYYKGDCWYRKTFGVPLSAKKLFVEFEGAMQVATVYVNGSLVGTHNNSGYTPFVFDVTQWITRGANNVVAVMLNNAINNDIPPGTTYTSQTSGRPDYLLYSGLYRPVWLHSKDSVYVPIYSQFIQTVNVSAGSAQIHALTPVRNDRTTTQTVSVTVTLFDAQTSVATLTSALSIAAGVLDTFDMTPPAIANPKLWSPSNPNMYSVQTLVRVVGVVVDSVVEPCGFRWITWATGAGGSLNLNGSRLEIRGVCTHQTQGWMENAVPDTRFWQELKQQKNMGCNSVRSAHYPRSQAFYDMCDKIGMLVYVEIPSWGWGYTPSGTCWTRIDNCVKEMILAARNHPSIYLWGLYNEPIVSGNFSSNITTLNNTAHSLDQTRLTAMSNIKTFNSAVTVPDVEGLNYTETGDAGAYRWLGTESRPTNTFTSTSYRGSTLDLDTTSVDGNNGNPYDVWSYMAFTLNNSGQLSGGHLWCFKDYNTPCNTCGSEGAVDRFTVPKTLFYMIRRYWTGVAPDYARPGTATTIQLLADTTRLRANGVDVFLLTASMRNASGALISSATGNVTFTVTPSNAGTIFGGNVVSAYGGRAGAFLQTSTTPAATIAVTAAYGGLTTQQITLTTLQDTNWVPPYTATAVKVAALLSRDLYKLRVTSTAKGLVLQCPPAEGKLTIVNCLGRTVYHREVTKGEQVFISRHSLGSGLMHAVWEGSGRRVSSRVNVM